MIAGGECSFTPLYGIAEVEENRGDARAVVVQRIVVGSILLAQSIAQHLHVFLVRDGEFGPGGDALLDVANDVILVPCEEGAIGGANGVGDGLAFVADDGGPGHVWFGEFNDMVAFFRGEEVVVEECARFPG